MATSHLAENLAFLRKENNLKQSEIQDRLGFIRNTWSNWENGRSEPNIEALLKIVDFFDISLSDLVVSDLEKGKLIFNEPDSEYELKGKLKGKKTGKLMPSREGELILQNRQAAVSSGNANIIKYQEEIIALQREVIIRLKADIERLTAENKALKKESPQVEERHENSKGAHSRKRSAWMEVKWKWIEVF